jgi:hypothetical protein
VIGTVEALRKESKPNVERCRKRRSAIMAKGRHLRHLSGILFFFLALVFSVSAASADQPKYVFFFLGDGMSATQIQATEAYLTVASTAAARASGRRPAANPNNRLHLEQAWPVQGMQTTFDDIRPDDRLGLVRHRLRLRRSRPRAP